MKKTLIWIIAVVVTIGIALYQKMTGPTYPLKVEYQEQVIKFIRSGTTGQPTPITIKGHSNYNSANVIWRYYPGDYSFDTLSMEYNGEYWAAQLPSQPPAGKLAYYVELMNEEGDIVFSTKDNPVIIRYKGEVSAWALIPHIIFMFAASLLSIATLFRIILNQGSYKLTALLTLISLALGGLVFGPIVQNYAFGHYWTGFPFGYDLTDNKTLLVFIIWAIALFANRKKENKVWIVFAIVSMIIINSIPHSTMGSELNRETGSVETAE
ncbi:MAG: hypothetical protein PHU27_03360 [Salinivirgaceae bacterium]|nr:hypothetical protein [Salinivirgaceae bacterium]MDD4748273.1 hypothetical protein [Salinivirgaceae bacterium]MDY0279234.1 hypothetical protein [Salinivirgaceae bacterium]